MGINILPSEIYNKISAGEVVERPASVVKELVENSIDGGATKITVEIFEGGIKKIIVSDNGTGIEPEDVEKAFLPHATSKISSETDLFSIASLGFRGEALASIAAVSQVELVSKTENNDYGISFKINGGVPESKSEVGFEKGTRISVSNLFFNTPARLKFLKKPKSEEGEITSLIAKIILANPTLSIRYIVDNRIVYNTFGNGLAEAMYIIYGKETYDNLLEVSYNRDEISVNGFIARPTFAKPNRTYQTLFVNGRVVSNYMISSAVQDAVDAYIMKGKFPLFALNISIPFEQVDVNVHPSKQEVKFENPGKIYGIVNSAIYKAVSNANYIQETTIFEEPVKSANEPENSKTNSSFELAKLLQEHAAKFNEGTTLKSSDSTLSKILAENLNNNLNKNEEKIDLNQIKLEEVEISPIIPEKNKEIIQQNIIPEFFEKYKIIGVLFETYILIEQDDLFYIIDQHAAHERQLFDKFSKEIEEGGLTLQSLLVPYVFSANLKETEFLENNLDALNSSGIEIIPFGENTFKVSAVPSILSQMNLKEFFSSILEETTGLSRKTNEALKNKIARHACRSAVKAGNKLSEGEIDVLLKSFKENKNVLLCPHGRPIVVVFKKTEIEKWFKRIV